MKLKDGDVIQPAYFVFADDMSQFIYGDEYTVNGDIEITYGPLPASDYSYSMTLYDVYGNYYYTPSVTFTIDDDGTVWFDSDELNG